MDDLGLSNPHEEQGEFNGLMKELKLYHECSGLIGQVCLFGSEYLKNLAWIANAGSEIMWAWKKRQKPDTDLIVEIHLTFNKRHKS